MRLVICDDDPVIRYLLEVVLGKRGGHDVRSVEHPEDVGDAVIDHDPHLVLLDYVMPRRTGLEVVEELRADPQTAGVKVVFLTGRVDIADEASLEALGIVGIIEKPFDTATLADRLVELAGR
ncbi:MAG TPA: response regulator [Acidimicrobiia bacterium]|nr:response regulator [Acidimicrobiia bacterium]